MQTLAHENELQALTPLYFFPSTIPQEMQPFVLSCRFVWEMLTKHDILFNHLNRTYIGSGSEIHPDVEIIGPVHVGAGTTIEAYVRIEGPAIIGEHCHISHSANIRPGTFINSNCRVGHGSEIKNSILLPYSKVSSLAFVGDTILGGHARIASGVITGNRRFDQAEIVIKYDEEAFHTGVHFLGCMLGEHSRLGVSVATNPGTLIGPHTFVDGLVTLSGFVPANRFIKLKQEIAIAENRFTGQLEH